MSAAITLRVQGEEVLERQLAGLLDRFGDLSELMDRFGMVLETSTIERFDDERAPDGASWLPSLRARTEGGKTLTDQGLLRQSITYNAGSDQVEIGSNLRYAAIHQFGGTIRGKNGPLHFRLPGGLGERTVQSVTIPARPFLGISAEDREELEAQVVDYLAEVAPEVER